MKWITPKEGLPKKRGYYFVKMEIEESKNVLWYDPLNRYFDSGKEKYADYEILQWLDESNSGEQQPDVFTIVLTSVGTEIISFRKRTNKISEEDDDYLTDAITKRIMRKLKEHKLTEND